MNRQMMQAAVLGVWAAWAIAAGAATAATVETKGAIEQVTVYRGQALVTRKVEVEAPGGTVDLVVTELPEQIIPGTLYATGDESVLIRAVRYRTRAVQEEPRPEVRQIDQQLEELAKQVRETQSQDTLQKQKEQFLTQLEGFTAARAGKEADSGTLKLETVTGLADYLLKGREQLAADALQRGEKVRDLQEKTAVLQRQREALTARSSRTAREAVLFLEKKNAGKAAVRLNYLVGAATWSPSYTLRCPAPGQQVDLEYNALVQQMSGEDWEGVALKLSTASPTMLASSPILTPLWVTLAPAGGKGPAEGISTRTFAEYLGGQKAFRGNLTRALRERAASPGEADQVDQDWAVNAEANKLQLMDLIATKDVIISGQDVAAAVAAAEVLSVSYALGGRIGVPSRSDQQMIQIASMKLDGKFYYLATPVLTPYVYQHADVVNTSDVALLSGPVSTYMDGQFMGTGTVPMVAKGQQLTVGFGVDSQLRVKRELGDKTDKVQGGNRVVTFAYRLLINNYKEHKVTVRLLDRLPDPRGADIKITPGRMDAELSKDELYLQTLRKMGILQWEVEVPAKASGASAKVVSYEFTMEFDRNMQVSEPTAAQVEQEKHEFRMNLQRMQMAD